MTSFNMSLLKIAARVAAVDPLMEKLLLIAQDWAESYADKDSFEEYVHEYFRHTPREEWDVENFNEFCSVFDEQ